MGSKKTKASKDKNKGDGHDLVKSEASCRSCIRHISFGFPFKQVSTDSCLDIVKTSTNDIVVTRFTPDGVSKMEMLPKVEEGDMVPWNDEREVSNGGELNPMLSLVPLAKGLHLLKPLPLSLIHVLPVVAFQQSELDIRASNLDLPIYGDLQQDESPIGPSDESNL